MNSRNYIALLLLIVFMAAGTASAQTAKGTAIENTGLGQFHYLNGVPSTFNSNKVTVSVSGVAKLTLNKTVSPTVALQGDTVQFTIVISNIGTAALAGVHITDTLSSDLQLLAAPGATIAGNVLTWYRGTIAESFVETLAVRARISPVLPFGATIGNSVFAADTLGDSVSSATVVHVNSMPHFVLSKVASKTALDSGDTLSYTIAYLNNGNIAGTNVSIVDTLPAFTRFLSANKGGVNSNGIVTWTLGTVNAGARDSVSVTVTIDPAIPDSTRLSNTATITSQNGGGKTASNITSSVVKVWHPRLSLTKTVSVDSVAPGSALQYVIRLANTGDTVLTNVRILDTLSTYARHITVSSNASLANGIISYHKDSLAVGATDSIVINMDLAITTPAGTLIRNTAFASTNQIGTEASPVVSSAVTPLQNAALSVTKTASKDSVFFGDTLSYRIVVRNAGLTLLTNIVVVDTLPAGFNVGSVAGNAVLTGNLVRYTKDSLVAAAAETIVVHGRLDTLLTDGQTIRNVIHGKSDETTEITGSAVVIAKIVPNPVMNFGKIASADSVTVGGTVRYTLWFQNAGNVPLTNVTITDTLPHQLVEVVASKGIVSQDSIVRFTKARLDVGAFDTVFVTARLRGDLNPNEQIINTAHNTSDQAGDVSKTAVITAKLIPLADMTITKTVSRDTVLASGTADYLIRIRNTGNRPLTGVTVTDTIPQELFILSVSKGTLNDHRLTYNRDTMSIGGVDSIVIKVSLPANTRPRRTFVNRATVVSNQAVARNAQASFVSTIVPAPGLVLTKSVSRDTLLVGDTLRYVIRIANTGNDDLTNLIVTDTLPKQLKLRSVSSNATVNGSVITYARNPFPFQGSDSIVISASVSVSQTTDETITNTVIATTTELPVQTAQAVSHSLFTRLPRMTLSKTVSTDTIVVGGSLTYVIRVANAGNVVLHNVSLVDTIPALLMNVNVSGTSTFNGRVLTYHRDSLAIGEEDSIRVTADVPAATANKTVIVNSVSGSANEVSRSTAQAVTVTKVIVTDASCLITVAASPRLLVGDGVEAAQITATVTDRLGHPKPDGTPVVFRSSVGIFSNGLDSIVKASVNGFVIDSLRVHLPVNTIITALATVSSRDSDICFSSDTVRVEVFPGAIQGIVTDNITHQAVQGATAEVFSQSNQRVGFQRTTADGRYLIPIATSGDYRVVITATTAYLKTTKIATTVHVDVPGSGGVPPVPNKNTISGTVFYKISNQPINVDGLHVYLWDGPPARTVRKNGATSVQAATLLDSARTDSNGIFQFFTTPGSYFVEVRDNSLHGSGAANNAIVGQTLINENIGTTPDGDLSIHKTGPANAFTSDTVTFTITATNNGAFAMSGGAIIDSLAPGMLFVSASNGGTYEPAGNRVVWPAVTLNPGSFVQRKVNVTFDTALVGAHSLINKANISTDQTNPAVDSALIVVRPNSKMRIWKLVSSPQASVNDSLLYQIFVKNFGGSTADSLTITDVLPSEVIYNSSLPGANFDSTTRTLSWHVDSLPVGQQREFKIFVHVRSDLTPGEHRYTNIADLTWHGGRANSFVDPASDATVNTIITYITITKQALTKIIEVGDAVTYIIHVTNMSPDTPAETLQVFDKIPAGFSYLSGSSMRDTVKIPDPKGTRELIWTLMDTLKPGQSVQLTYRLIAGSGAVNGDGINRAMARASSGGSLALATATVQERVEVRRGIFSQHGLIVGKVFFDDDLNAHQDLGDSGVKGVELMMEDGTRILTGDDGKYSLPDVMPGQHVIRVRQASLPKGSRLHTGYGVFAGDASSRFVMVPDGGIGRADFYLDGHPVAVADSTPARIAVGRLGVITARRIVEPKNLVFVNEDASGPLKLSGSQFEIGKATLRPEAFPVLKGLADMMREYMQQSLTIAGHTDSMPIKTKEFPSNQVLSEARARAVQRYLVDVEHIDSNRITAVGFGDSEPLRTNATKEGRTANRRVEMRLSGDASQPTVYTATVTFTIPLSYSGPGNVKSIIVRDELDSTYHLIQGSAQLNGKPVQMQSNGSSVTFTVDGITSNFEGSLSYRALVNRPSAKQVTVSSATSIGYTTSDTTLAPEGSVRTSNVLATATKAKGMKFTLSGVTFDVGKASLKESMLGNLSNVVAILKENPTATVVIDGHTDASPIHTKEFSSNVDLSHARANTVLDYLVSQTGISKSQFTAYGWGEMRPLAPNTSAEGKATNRRVEIQVFKKEFNEETIQGGLSDTSDVVRVRAAAIKNFVPADSSSEGATGDRFLITAELPANSSKDVVSRTMTLKIPDGLRLLPNSAMTTPAHGASVSENSISVTDTTAGVLNITCTTELVRSIDTPSGLKAVLTITRRMNDGREMVTTREAVLITMKKK